MPPALQDVVSELARQLVGAGLWWAALVVLVLVALLIVAARRGWVKLGDPRPETSRDDVRRDGVPDAAWDANVQPNDDPDAATKNGA